MFVVMRRHTQGVTAPRRNPGPRPSSETLRATEAGNAWMREDHVPAVVHEEHLTRLSPKTNSGTSFDLPARL